LPEEHALSLMIVTCGDCGARFHLDPALLKDSSAARIRCRKCGGLIVVRLHEESPVPVLPPQETIPPSTVEPSAPAQEPVSPWPVESSTPAQEWVSPWPVEPSAPAQEPPATEPDISVVVGSEPEPEPVQPGTVYLRLEDMFADPLPPEEHPAGGNPPEETAATEPGRKAPSRRAPSMPAVLVISVLWILLLAAGALYFGTTKSGHDMLGKLFAGWGSARTGSAPKMPVYDIRDVKWHVDKSSAGGSLFVIRGAVANVGNVPSAGIRIQATLLGKDNEALAEKAAFAGNLIDETTMRQTERGVIEGVMSNRFGEGNVNKEIPPGKALPFMVLFFDPPGEIAAVMVKAIDAR
jgi:DNA-directed RNA polymerase subunit RPC12/RpoP